MKASYLIKSLCIFMALSALPITSAVACPLCDGGNDETPTQQPAPKPEKEQSE